MAFYDTLKKKASTVLFVRDTVQISIPHADNCVQIPWNVTIKASSWNGNHKMNQKRITKPQNRVIQSLYRLFLFYSQPQLPLQNWKLQVFKLWTPGFLLTPLTPLWNLGVTSPIPQLFWIFLQNALNILLLFPLIFQLLYLIPSPTRKNEAMWFCLAFVSLSIQCTQLVLDFSLVFNRII